VTGFDPHKHHRRSIRLKGWDYRSPAYYFVTICSHERQNLFENPEFRDIAAYALEQAPIQPHAQHVALDEWVVMPNHVHVIFVFRDFPAQADLEDSAEHFRHALAGSLGVVVGQYKSAVTSRINNLRQSKGARVWQRGYYERIIRNEREWRATQRYIIENPARWVEDRENLDGLLARMTLRGSVS
jgi:REP element-mobilizing transposase RayT